MKEKAKENGNISLFVLIACIFFTVILGGVYISSMNKLQNQEQSISKIQENYNRNLATAEDWVDENSGIKVDLSQATATEPDVLEGQTFYSGDENIKIGIMPNRGDIQTAKNQYFYTHSDGVTYLVSWMPGGYYRGWQTASDGTMCAETWTPQARIAEAAGLTSAKLLAGQTVMGVTGTATSDATASASQILSGKTAYVNGSKVTGTMANYAGNPQHINYYRDYNGRYEFAVNAGYHGCSWDGNSYNYMSKSEIASLVGATPEKIVVGQSIAGVTGTGTGHKSGDVELVANFISNAVVSLNTSNIANIMWWRNGYSNGKLPAGKYYFYATWPCYDPGGTWYSSINISGYGFTSEINWYSCFAGYCNFTGSNGTFNFTVQYNTRDYEKVHFELFRVY